MVDDLVKIPHPLRAGETLWVHPAWLWQEGERRSYTIHYDLYQGMHWLHTSCCAAWAFSAAEALELATVAAETQGWQLERVTVQEESPVVYYVETGKCGPRERYREGAPLVDL